MKPLDDGIDDQIAQHLHRTAKSWLSIDGPVLPVQPANELCELLGIGQSSGRACTMEFLAAVKAFQIGEKFPAKDATEDFHE